MPNEIHFQSPAGELVRGQPLTVPIRLNLETPLKVRGIQARFHGAEETKADYTTTSTDSKGNTTTHHHTAVELVDVIDQKHLLRGSEPQGTLRNIGDAVATMFGGGRHEVLDASAYDFQVEVTVPADAPATHTGQRSRVFYELSLCVDVPLAFDLKATQAFQVARSDAAEVEPKPVRVRYPEDKGRGFWDSIFSPDVRVELALARDTLRIGETVEGIFSVESTKAFKVRAIRARLFGIEQSSAQSHTDSRMHEGEPVELAGAGEIEGSFSQEFTFTAEIDAPPTTRGKLFSIDWYVQVEFDVPWSRDPKIRAPITLLPRANSNLESSSLGPGG